jgi:hypothetical protein
MEVMCEVFSLGDAWREWGSVRVFKRGCMFIS